MVSSPPKQMFGKHAVQRILPKVINIMHTWPLKVILKGEVSPRHFMQIG